MIFAIQNPAIRTKSIINTSNFTQIQKGKIPIKY